MGARACHCLPSRDGDQPSKTVTTLPWGQAAASEPRKNRVIVPENEVEWIAPPVVNPTRPDEARCEVLGVEPLWGQDKWLGGAASFCGKYVYGVPGKAKRVLRITCATGEVEQVGPSFKGEFKWLRGAESPVDECMYCMPSNADSVLCINPKTGDIDTFGGPFKGDWLWHGGNIV